MAADGTLPVTHAAGRFALPAALAGLALLVVLLVITTRPPSPRGLDAPAHEFSAARASGILERLLAEGVPHRVGTPANFVVRDRILGELNALGYEPQVQRAFSCRGPSCAPVENILARLPGAAADAGAVMLVSHYDSRGAGPGAADAGASVAAILEIARVLREEAPYHHPVILLITDGEEVGLLGAQAFVDEHPWAADVRVAINLEARGSAGPSAMFETSADNGWLVSAWARAASRPFASSLMYEAYRLLPNDTDATVFRRAGMDVLNYAFIDELVHYHSARDDLANLDPRSLQHQGDNALAAVRGLAGQPMQPRPGDATYTDLFGRFFVSWPAAWTLPLAVVLGLVIVAAAVVLMVRRVLRPVALAVALLAVVVAVVLALGSGWAAARVLESAIGANGLHAHAWLFEVALWSLAAWAVLSVALVFARWAGFPGLLVAPWLVLSVAALALAARLPGAAVVLVVPQAIAAAGVLVVALLSGRGRTDRMRHALSACAVVLCLGAGLTLLQLARLLQVTFVLQMPLVITAVVALAALPLMSLVAVDARDRIVPGVVTAGLAVVAIAAGVAAVLAPTWSELRPQPLNIVFVQVADDDAYWAVQGVRTAAELPRPLRDAGFDEPLPDLLPGAAGLPALRAEPVSLPAARLEIIGETVVDDGRRVSTRLHATEPGNRVLLVMPGTVRPIVEGLRGAGRRLRDDRVLLMIHGVPAGGVAVDFEVAGPEPASVMLFDHTPGLPAGGADLLRARPATAAPIGDGDVSIVRAVARF